MPSYRICSFTDYQIFRFPVWRYEAEKRFQHCLIAPLFTLFVLWFEFSKIERSLCCVVYPQSSSGGTKTTIFTCCDRAINNFHLEKPIDSCHRALRARFASISAEKTCDTFSRVFVVLAFVSACRIYFFRYIVTSLERESFSILIWRKLASIWLYISLQQWDRHFEKRCPDLSGSRNWCVFICSTDTIHRPSYFLKRLVSMV